MAEDLQVQGGGGALMQTGGEPAAQALNSLARPRWEGKGYQASRVDCRHLNGCRAWIGDR